MPDTALANLPALVGSLTGNELFYSDNGSDVKVSANQIKAFTGGGGGGGSSPSELVVFSTPSVAQSGTIADTTNFVAVQGFKAPGDGGAATYQRVNSLPSLYVGDGTTTPFVPPSFTSGGLPVLCFATTEATFSLHSGIIGPITQPIIAGSLAFLTVFSWGTTLPSTITDSAGNVYLLAADSNNGSGFSVTSLFYCANPVFAPIGTTITVPFGGRAINVYSVPGFTGAVLDQTAIFTDNAVSSTTGATVTTGTLSASPELAIGMCYAGGVVSANTDGAVYTAPVGWTDLEPVINGKNATACFVTSGTSAVTFNPTWPAFTTNRFAVLATFKTFPRSSLDASFWSLLGSAPLHTSAFGVDASSPDNVQTFRSFGRYLARIAPPSGEITQTRAGTPTSGTVVISIANPAIVTVTVVAPLINHNLHNGMMISFSTTGTLPAPIVAGQIYYIQYGSVTPTTFQISTTPLLDPVPGVNGGGQTQPKGTAISTLGGSQSGTHSYTTYGQSWSDFILDPGIYYASANQVPGLGTGIQKWRMLAYGARIATNANFFGQCTNDVNAATGGSTFAYTAQFQTTIEVHNSGNFNNYVTLVTPGQAVNFYVNSWVVLMNIEQQASADGNWNPAIFEYAKVQSVDAVGGVITFWDRLQNNYRSTYPQFKSQSFATTGGQTGSATIVQLSDVFDQEIEVHGMNEWGITEGTIGGCLSVRFVDCDFWGWAFDSGPSCVFLRRYIVENCRFHNCIPELDKMVDFLLYRDCDFDLSSYPRFQSASINKVVMDRCKMMGGFSGTPKDLTIRDSFIAGTFTYGPVYGSTQRMTLVNTHVERILNNDQATTVLIIGIAGVTFANGTIKIASGTTTLFGVWNGPNTVSVCPAPWAQPGAKILIEPVAGVGTSGTVKPIGGGSTIAPITCFTVLDVYTDGGGSFCIDTDMQALPNTGFTVTGTISGGVLTVTSTSPANAFLLLGTVLTGGTLPANTAVSGDHGGMPGVATGVYGLSGAPPNNATPTTYTAAIPMNYLPHPCPRLTTINCTGGQWASEQAGAPPDIPMFSYFKRAFAGTAAATGFHDKELHLSGNLLTWTINVLRSYTGVGATCTCDIYIGGYAVSGGITYPTYIHQNIDLKTVGLRTITAAGVSGSVGADSIAAIPFWISGQHIAIVGGGDATDTMANMPFFVMQAQTDQQIGFASILVNTQTGARPAGTLADVCRYDDDDIPAAIMPITGFVSSCLGSALPSTPVDPATSAWVAAVIANGGTVSAGRQTLVDVLIAGLKSDGIWTKLDRLWICAAENEPSALTDMVNQILAVANAGGTTLPTFTTDRGYTGTSGGYIDAMTNLSTYGGQFTTNSGHISAWAINSMTDIFNLIGVSNNNQTTDQTVIIAQYSDGNAYLRCNDSTPSGGVAVPDGTGHHLANRSGASASQGYRNGSNIITPNAAAGSIPNVNMIFPGGNDSTQGILPADTFVQCSQASIGGNLSATDVTNFYNRLRTYMTAVGVP